MSDTKSKNQSSLNVREASQNQEASPERRETTEFVDAVKPKDEIPAFPFDLTNLMAIQFDNLKAAIEYLARQQGEQQILINEMVTAAPGARTSAHRSIRSKSRMDKSDLNRTGMDGSVRKDAEGLDLDAEMALEEDIDLPTMKKYLDELLEKDEKYEIRFEEMEDRVQRMELSTGARDQLVKKGK